MTPHIDLNTIITATVGAILLAALGLAYRWFKKTFIRRTELIEMQIDSMHYGLRSVNHGFGEEYEKGYREHLEKLIKEKNFIEQ